MYIVTDSGVRALIDVFNVSIEKINARQRAHSSSSPGVRPGGAPRREWAGAAAQTQGQPAAGVERPDFGLGAGAGRHAVFPRPFARTAAGTGSDPPARAFFEPPDARVETLRQPAVPVLRLGASARSFWSTCRRWSRAGGPGNGSCGSSSAATTRGQMTAASRAARPLLARLGDVVEACAAQLGDPARNEGGWTEEGGGRKADRRTTENGWAAKRRKRRKNRRADECRRAEGGVWPTEHPEHTEGFEQEGRERTEGGGRAAEDGPQRGAKGARSRTADG